jgi:tetratricopeptide (TPR) repeat protein
LRIHYKTPATNEVNIVVDLNPELAKLRTEISLIETRLETRLTERLADSGKAIETYKWSFDTFFKILIGIGALIAAAGAAGLWQTITAMSNVSQMTQSVFAIQQQTHDLETKAAATKRQLDTFVDVQKTFLSHIVPFLRQPREAGIDFIMTLLQFRPDPDDVQSMRETAQRGKEAADRERQALDIVPAQEGDKESDRGVIGSERSVIGLELRFYDNLISSLNEVFSGGSSKASKEFQLEALDKALTQWTEFQTAVDKELFASSQGTIFVQRLDAYGHYLIGTLCYRRDFLEPSIDYLKRAKDEFEKAEQYNGSYANAWTGCGVIYSLLAQPEFKELFIASSKDVPSLTKLLTQFEFSLAHSERAISLAHDDKLILRTYNNLAVAYYNKAIVHLLLGQRDAAEQALKDADEQLKAITTRANRLPNIYATEAEVRLAWIVFDEATWKASNVRELKLNEILALFKEAKRWNWTYNTTWDEFIDRFWMLRRMDILSPNWKEELKQTLDLR